MNCANLRFSEVDVSDEEVVVVSLENDAPKHAADTFTLRLDSNLWLYSSKDSPLIVFRSTCALKFDCLMRFSLLTASKLTTECWIDDVSQ
ncbi:MAG: hypothetical protein U0K59_00640 [Bacteroidales bacterium]|nr:hypothetical protein [Bacteroidales bacterium]